MPTILIPIIDYGARGIASGESYDSRKFLVRDVAEGQFDYSDGRGLMRVLEVDTETYASTDGSAAIAREVEHYIAANAMDADGNVLRFLQDHGAVPVWVAAIKEGEMAAAEVGRAA